MKKRPHRKDMPMSNFFQTKFEKMQQSGHTSSTRIHLQPAGARAIIIQTETFEELFKLRNARDAARLSLSRLEAQIEDVWVKVSSLGAVPSVSAITSPCLRIHEGRVLSVSL